MARSSVLLSFALACLALLALALPAPAGPSDDLEPLRQEAVAGLIDDLAQLASWCNSKKLFASRNEVYRSLLAFEPDHEDARRFLGYRRKRDGGWDEPTNGRPVTDRNKSAAKQFPDKRGAAVATFRERIIALLESNDIEPTSERGKGLLGEVLAADPDDAAVRELLGELRMEDRWVLIDTSVAKERRAQMAEWAKAAVKSSASVVEVIEPRPEEAGLVDRWSIGLGTPEVRVLATTSEKDARKTCRAAHSVGTFFREAFGSATGPWEGYTIYVLPGEGERESFIAGYPDLTDEERKNLALYTGSGLPGKADVVSWDEDEARRLDALTRHTISLYLQAAYGVTTGHGWIWEGFGQYLTRRLIGTRLTWYVGSLGSTADGNAELRGRLLAETTNWMAEGYAVLVGSKRGSLGELLDKSIDQMDAEDMLLAYSLAAYLLEARYNEVGRILARVGQGPRGADKQPGEPASVVVPEELGLDLPQLEARLARWQSERR